MDRKTQRIVGIHLLAPGAGDLIGQAELVLKNRMAVDQVLDTPTAVCSTTCGGVIAIKTLVAWGDDPGGPFALRHAREPNSPSANAFPLRREFVQLIPFGPADSRPLQVWRGGS